jgi:hypothetical protein
MHSMHIHQEIDNHIEVIMEEILSTPDDELPSYVETLVTQLFHILNCPAEKPVENV